MNLAFWNWGRKAKPELAQSGETNRVRKSATADHEDSPADPLRTRARHRLIGAAALLLAVVIVVPMLLDDVPPPVADDIPIELPSDKNPFVPKVDQPAPTASAENPPAAPGSVADAAAEPEPAQGHASAEHLSTSHPDPDASATVPAQARKAQVVLQIASYSRESAAKELSDKLAKWNITAFIERTKVHGSAVFRVRAGPFNSRAEATAMKDRLSGHEIQSVIEGP